MPGSDSLPPSELLDVYKLAVEMADRVSARRGLANQFYLSLETLILGVPALLQVSDNGPALGEGRASILSILGIVVALVWWLQLRSYRQLNKAKFDVINSIEGEHMTIRIFSDEWKSLKSDHVERWRPRYAELGTVERVVPGIFAAMNLAVLVLAART
ncbi:MULTISPECIES: hypothetical protein [unclassified Rhodococcus (in: high G+C Gram-positive bacteria)]|uniref:RipA family octameric membrane protein n=1 Tax=unclassified Rhodococcus (in: high G+C Gram-positive bacteria) TaxID=192944 RepID=UPI002954FBC7|nr:hypothetical protein [Rhodococcus sp. IEGM 27]MDV8030794.1 hypothetical protein [Rhodococcus sp. IEGM 27]